MSKGGSSEQIIGYDYSLGMHMGLCRGPIDELVEIRVGDKSAWPFPENAAKTEENAPVPIDWSQPQTYPVATSVQLEIYEYNPGYDALIFYLVFKPSFVGQQYVQIIGSTRMLTTMEGGTTTLRPVSIDGIYEILAIYDGQLSVKTAMRDRVNFYEWLDAAASPADAQMTIQVVHQDGSPYDPSESTDPGSFKPPVNTGRVLASTSFQISARDLFGGTSGEGGIDGLCHMLMGEATQVAPAALKAMLGGDQPDFRGVATMFYDGLISSMNPYPKVWKMRMRRNTKGWSNDVPFLPSHALIVMTRPTTADEVTSTANIHAQNIIHVIYEALTNVEWGRGIDPAALKTAAWEGAAVQAFNEGFGVCVRWSRGDTIESFVQNMLDHVNATIYEDKETAQITIKLIRQDYVVAELPVFDATSGLLSVDAAPVASGGNYTNEIKVTYYDPITDKESQVRVQNIGAIQATGGAIVSQSKTYLGLPTPALATRVAQRELRVVGRELRKFDVTLDRRGSGLRPGDCFVLRDPSRNIGATVVRVVTFRDGTLLDGKVKVAGVQDVFGLPSTPAVSNQPTTWTPPVTNPCVGRHEVFEIPYVVLARTMSPADFAQITEESGYAGAVLEQGQSANASYRLAIRNGAPTSDDMPSTTANYCGYVPPAP